MAEAVDNGLPSAEQLLVFGALYVKYPLSGSDLQLSGLRRFGGSVNAYCVGCRQTSVFRGDWGLRPGADMEMPGRGVRSGPPAEEVFLVTLICARDRSHVMRVLFHYGSGVLVKVGQYPSLADMLLPGLDRYRPVLSDEARTELGTAIGLRAHGVGVGSFVYLRRIFESLVAEVHEQVRSESGWDEDRYQRGRMDEKIRLLGANLPGALRVNSGVYGILSKGIHELSDDECAQHFEAVRLGIELILDEKLERQRRSHQQKVLSNEIGRIRGVLRTSPPNDAPGEEPKG